MTAVGNSMAVLLACIGRWEAAPGEALSAIRSAMEDVDRYGERVYAALRDLAWSLVTSRAEPSEVTAWFDIIRHVAALARRRDAHALETQLLVLADLLGQSARFSDRHPIEDVGRRKIMVDVLNAVQEAGGSASHAAIAATAGLARAHLSGLLVILCCSGMLERHVSAEGAGFRLTAAGLQAVAQCKASGSAAEA